MTVRKKNPLFLRGHYATDYTPKPLNHNLSLIKLIIKISHQEFGCLAIFK